ncbi:MAG: CHAT domain-containing protein [Leptospirales bacterium]|nr:CHAT domain-containing protein [Leptospirales bacterium]
MEFVSLIIDRVNVTNVFNVIQGRLPAREAHLQTRVDDDLIQEFLSEVNRMAQNSLAASALAPGEDLLRELRRVGETFYLQFFPEAIQERLRAAQDAFVFLHVDHSLRNIPWELLHDGRSFLADRFFLGKNVAGYWRDQTRAERDRLRMLIIADPTEDLEWARLEGEGLFESLNAEVSPDRLDVQFMAGRRITKLGILNAVKDRDIIHFAGHMHYSKEQQESGWLLSDGKVLRAREIEKAGLAPALVFSNSCLSAATETEEETAGEGMPARFNDLAGAFLKTGIGNYVGTNWEIRDSRLTYDFALQFYRALFDEKSVGEALFEARRHARRAFPPADFTWANYVLHGNPMTRIYRESNRRSFEASRSVLFVRRVLERYPLPIARAYSEVQKSQDSSDSQRQLLNLWLLLESLLSMVGAIVFGNCRRLSLTAPSDDASFTTLRELGEAIYESLGAVRSLHMELAAGRLMESMYLHRDQIEKMIGARESWLGGELASDEFDSLAVTYQYFLDNLLNDLAALGRCQIFYFPSSGEDAISLSGQHAATMRVLPAEFYEPETQKLLEAGRGRVFYFSSARRALFALWSGVACNTAGQLQLPEFSAEASAFQGAARLQ